jgi:hypothetical protein
MLIVLLLLLLLWSSLELIAQEVMSYKASKDQSFLGVQNSGLRRATSLSAADRTATTAAAKNTPHTIQEEPAVAQEAPGNQLGTSMDVDEDLERELSHGMQA